MPVFDFSNDTSEIKEEVVCTYTTFSSKIHHIQEQNTIEVRGKIIASAT